MENSFWAFILMLVPVVETRGGIPVGLALGVQPVILFILSAISAGLIFTIGRTALEQFYSKVLIKSSFLTINLQRLRTRALPFINKFGYPGLVLFVAIPLPGTGAYGGTGASWVLGLDKKKSFIAILCGALISAGIIMVLANRIIGN